MSSIYWFSVGSEYTAHVTDVQGCVKKNTVPVIENTGHVVDVPGSVKDNRR